MNDFRLYFVNTTIGGPDETLCYTDLNIPGYPNTTQDINCYGLTKKVFFLNRYKTIALCHIAINGKKVKKKNMTNACILVCIHSELYDKIILDCYFPNIY